MGDTLRFAERMDLIAMESRADLSSTGFALANRGQEYLVLQPGGAAGPFTVLLEPGTFAAEWFSIEARQTVPADPTTIDRPMGTGFSPPSEASRSHRPLLAEGRTLTAVYPRATADGRKASPHRRHV
jgi:hypothetical protein